jgi:hypothetical protein
MNPAMKTLASSMAMQDKATRHDTNRSDAP